MIRGASHHQSKVSFMVVVMDVYMPVMGMHVDGECVMFAVMVMHMNVMLTIVVQVHVKFMMWFKMDMVMSFVVHMNMNLLRFGSVYACCQRKEHQRNCQNSSVVIHNYLLSAEDGIPIVPKTTRRVNVLTR